MELFLIFEWWFIFFSIGILFFPLTYLIFPQFLDNGYIFSKIIGVLFVSYTIFIFGTLRILPFTQGTIFFILWIFIFLLYFLYKKNKQSLIQTIRKNITLYCFEELIFFLTFFFWCYIRSFQPEIHGLEKFMDLGFVNSILRSDYFPPLDMWFTPFSINYYYFGHFITAVLTKLSNIPSFYTYNMMIATLFAFTFTCSFSIGVNLINQLKIKNPKSKITIQNSKVLICGLLTAFLVSFGGNLHTIYTFFKPYINENPVPFWQLPFSPTTFPNSYWYPNATRFIHNTIHEFPIYSFVVSDLHGHVLDIPLVLLTIAVLLSLITKSQIINHKSPINTNVQNSKHFGFGALNLFRISDFGFRILLLAFLLAVMYMTNAWDGLIYFLLSALVLLYLTSRQFFSYPFGENQKVKIFNFFIPSFIFHFSFFILLLLGGFILFSLPFSLNFKPFVSGIGVICAPEFLIKTGKLGPFLFEADHCLRSPWWQLLILHGFFYFWAISFIVFLIQKTRQIENLKFKIFNFKLQLLNLNFRLLTTSDIFVLLLIFLSTILILIPEFIYAKDIYPGHYRANTMFKLGYEAFIMLSISSGYIMVRLFSNIKSNVSKIFFIFQLSTFILVAIYPYFSIMSFYGNLTTYSGLNGVTYLKRAYPTDFEAIMWLNQSVKGQPVIAEAQGDSYTDYGRVSVNTGLPTILGWTVHEWLWRGTYDIPAPRIPDVTTLYETTDVQTAKNLIKKYKVELIFIGDLERQKYPNLSESKFQQLGKIIYQNGNTKIYKIL